MTATWNLKVNETTKSNFNLFKSPYLSNAIELQRDADTDQLVKSYNMCILFLKKFKFRILIFKLLLWTILVDISLLTI